MSEMHGPAQPTVRPNSDPRDRSSTLHRHTALAVAVIALSLALPTAALASATSPTSLFQTPPSMSIPPEPLLSPPGEPTITSLSPAKGRVAGGVNVHINGTNLSGATAVSFGSKSAVSFTVRSPKQIIAVDPIGSGTVNVQVTTPMGTTATVPADEFTYVGEAPKVGRIGPHEGPAAGGTVVGIQGRNFLEATAVYFGSVSAASFTVNSDRSITATAPEDQVGGVVITVTTPYGPTVCTKRRFCSVHDYFKYKDITITSVTPDTGSVAGGTTVTVTGTGFAPGATGTVFKFHSTPAASVDCTSFTTCTLVTPPHRAGGTDVSAASAEQHTRRTAGDRFTFE